MHLKFRNVNEAFTGIVGRIHKGVVTTDVLPSRAGEVMQIEEPVVITYERPLERVLFNAARDANCFFALYEALWMLAGRNDVAPLAYYNSQIAEIASDDGETFNGAYGYRWRHAEGRFYQSEGDYEYHDQLEILINHLKNNSRSRRAVLQMWTVEDDLLKIDSSKDVCCNTNIYFAIENGVCGNCEGTGKIVKWGSPEYDEDGTCIFCKGFPHDVPRYLNMTVCNRSNDLVWGALGANVVHFSILQEYMASHLGLECGVYNHFTNNLHCYTSRWEPEKWLAKESSRTMHDTPLPSYDTAKNLVPLVSDPATFDEELPEFVERHSRLADTGHYKEPFLATVAEPMMLAFHWHKRKDYATSMRAMEMVRADDWRIAGAEWLIKRHGAYLRKQRREMDPSVAEEIVE